MFTTEASNQTLPTHYNKSTMKYTVAFAALVGAAMAAPLSTSTRQGVTYTDENGVEYYQDSTGQWFYYPSPSPVAPATTAPTPEPTPAMPGSNVGLDSGVEAGAKGDTSVSVAADETMAAASGNGMNGVIAAAAATPGTPAALGMAF